MRIFLFLDFDGTLAPLVPDPQDARLPFGAKSVLKKISNNPGIKMAIISGRSLKDIKSKVGLKNIFYAGNHGAEIHGPGINLKLPLNRKTKIAFKNIIQAIKKELRGFKGAIIENKGSAISVHYRKIEKRRAPTLKRIFRRIIKPYHNSGDIRIDSGKKVLEILPPEIWNKGDAVKYILSKSKFKNYSPVYIGDDRTDEDAFKALKGKGITFHVGRSGRTSAQYCFKDTKDVYRLLKEIAENE